MFGPWKRINELKREVSGLKMDVKDRDEIIIFMDKERREKDEVIKTFKEVDIPELQGQVLKQRGFAQTYKLLWSNALDVPLLKNYLINEHTYDPWNDPALSSYETIIVDLKYQTFSKANWLDFLEAVYREVKPLVPRWIKEVSDCDNFSSVMSSAIQLSAIESKKKRQPAFAIAHSRTHAYNVFFDTSPQGWVWEPQNNRLIGKLGETEEPYDTRRIIFIG